MADTQTAFSQHVNSWRLIAWPLAWLTGVAWHLQQAELASAWWQCAFLLVGLVLLAVTTLWLPLRLRPATLASKWLSTLAPLIGMVLIAYGSSGLHALARLSESLPAALEGQNIVIEGQVQSLPQRGASGLRFQFQVNSAQLQGQAIELPRTLALGWYSGWHEDAVLTPQQTELRAGQRWRFTVRLRKPHGHLNPEGFDQELSLFERGVRATGSVRELPAPVLIATPSLWDASLPIERMRQAVRDAIQARVPDARAAGVLAALSIGDQGAIERGDWEIFRQTGIAHLVSISGLHVTMLAWLAGIVISWLWRRSHRAMHWLPAPLAARWGGLIAALFYALLSGFGVPAQRTVWMLAVVTLLNTKSVRWPWPLVLLAAAVVVTLLDPWALLQPGFWLSFAAVGLLMASSAVATSGGFDPQQVITDTPPEPPKPITRLISTVRQGLKTQWIATLGLTPLTLVFFQQTSLIGFMANALAIPWVTLIVTPLALLGVVSPPLWSLGAAAVQLMVQVLTFLAHLPGTVWSAAVAPWWVQLAALLGAALLVMPLPWRLRTLGLLLTLPLLAPPREVPASGQFEMLVLDVGQGTSALIRTRKHVLLYDTGPQYSRDSDAGRRVLLPLLRARGETHLNRLVLSHRDLDHVGGAVTLLTQIPVGDLLSSLEASNPLLQTPNKGHPLKTERCLAGQSWTWDGVRFEVLHPRAEDYRLNSSSNSLSCVIKVQGRGQSALLTGDIERLQELSLLQNTPASSLKTQVMLAPHHGSKTSSTAAWLDVVKPELTLVQAGYRNRFNHPAAEVTARYQDRHLAVLDSAHCGAWHWQVTPQPTGEDHNPLTTGQCERMRAKRYWHWREAN